MLVGQPRIDIERTDRWKVTSDRSVMRESSSDLVGVDERIGQPCSRISKRFEASLLTD